MRYRSIKTDITNLNILRERILPSIPSFIRLNNPVYLSPCLSVFLSLCLSVSRFPCLPVFLSFFERENRETERLRNREKTERQGDRETGRIQRDQEKTGRQRDREKTERLRDREKTGRRQGDRETERQRDREKTERLRDREKTERQRDRETGRRQGDRETAVAEQHPDSCHRGWSQHSEYNNVTTLQPPRLPGGIVAVFTLTPCIYSSGEHYTKSRKGATRHAGTLPVCTTGANCYAEESSLSPCWPMATES